MTTTFPFRSITYTNKSPINPMGLIYGITRQLYMKNDSYQSPANNGSVGVGLIGGREMKVFETIMTKLGFISIYSHELAMEEFRSACEEFAKDHLDASDGATIGAESSNVYGAEFKYHNVVIGSHMRLDDCKFKSLAIAPWCKRVLINNAQFDVPPVKRQRAVVRVTSDKWDAATRGAFVMERTQ